MLGEKKSYRTGRRLVLSNAAPKVQSNHPAGKMVDRPAANHGLAKRDWVWVLAKRDGVWMLAKRGCVWVLAKRGCVWVLAKRGWVWVLPRHRNSVCKSTAGTAQLAQYLLKNGNWGRVV